MTKSNEYAVAHPDEVRAIVPTYTKIAKEAVGSLPMPEYKVTLDKKVFEHYAGLLRELGATKQDVDLDALLGAS